MQVFQCVYVVKDREREYRPVLCSVEEMRDFFYLLSNYGHTIMYFVHYIPRGIDL